MATVLVGPFVDWFPNARGGAHFGFMLGAGAFGMDYEVSAASVERSGRVTVGGGGSVWGGNDFWIIDQWSLGGALRLTGMTPRKVAGFNDDHTDSVGSFELVFTGLYY